MRIYLKNKEDFVRLVLTKGYNLNALSTEIGKCRQCLGRVLKNGSLGADPAMNIAKTLEVDYEELFEIK